MCEFVLQTYYIILKFHISASTLLVLFCDLVILYVLLCLLHFCPGGNTKYGSVVGFYYYSRRPWLDTLSGITPQPLTEM